MKLEPCPKCGSGDIDKMDYDDGIYYFCGECGLLNAYVYDYGNGDESDPIEVDYCNNYSAQRGWNRFVKRYKEPPCNA